MLKSTNPIRAPHRLLRAFAAPGLAPYPIHSISVVYNARKQILPDNAWTRHAHGYLITDDTLLLSARP